MPQWPKEWLDAIKNMYLGAPMAFNPSATLTELHRRGIVKDPPAKREIWMCDGCWAIASGPYITHKTQVTCVSKTIHFVESEE